MCELKKNRDMSYGILTNIDMKRRKYKALYWSMFAFLVIYGVIISCFPVIWILLSGFKTVKEMYAIPVTLFPENFDLGKLADAWNSMKFYRYYLNTFLMAIGAVVSVLIVTGFAGYVLSKVKPKGSKFVFMVFFWVMLLPSTLRTVPLYMSFKDFPYLHINMLDTYWPVWLIAASNTFDILLFKNFFDGISTSIVESAKIDGAGPLRIFFRIMLPMSMPVFLIVAVLTFNGQLGSFFWPLLTISDKTKRVLGLQLYLMKSSNFSMDYQMLAIIFSIMPQLIIFAIFQKKIIGGINVGAVKG